MRRVVPLILTLVTEAAAVTGLHLLGGEPGFGIPFDHLGDWLQSAPLIEVLAGILRLVLLIGAWWLLVGTLLCVFAHFTGAPAAVRASARVTPSPLRRRVDRALVASIVAGSLFVGATPVLAGETPVDPAVEDPAALASPVGETPVVDTPAVDPPAADPAPEVPVRTGRTGDAAAVAEVTAALPDVDVDVPVRAPVAEAPAVPRPTPDSPRGSSDGGAPPPPADSLAIAAPAAAAPDTHTVLAGDTLWDLAASQLATATGRSLAQLTNAEVVVYWVRVCELNRPRLRSGDPNLIFPGEVIELPPV